MTIGQIGALGFSSSMLGFVPWTHAASSAEAGRAALFLYFLLLFSVIAGATFLNERYCCSIVLGGSEAAFAIAEVNVSLSAGDELLVLCKSDRVVIIPKPKKFAKRTRGLHSEVWQGAEAYLHSEREGW